MSPLALICALLCFLVATFFDGAFGVNDGDWTSAGLALFVVAFLLPAVPTLPWYRRD